MKQWNQQWRGVAFGALFCGLYILTPQVSWAAPVAWRIDFGNGALENGFLQITQSSTFNEERGAGWISGAEGVSSRDRRGPSALERDFVMSTQPATFEMNLRPGQYAMRVIVADPQHGDHSLKIKSSSIAADLPVLNPKAGEVTTLTVPVSIPASAGDSAKLDLEFSTTGKNWIVNALILDPATKEVKQQVETAKLVIGDTTTTGPAVKDTWQDVKSWPDPMKPYLETFLQNQKNDAGFKATRLSRKNYFDVTAGVVDFFKQHQDANGAIIDPYKHDEWQYSTPCFAFAAAQLVVNGGRKDLLEPAAKAMDWACLTLSEKRAATAHEDFYPPQLAHALPLLKPLVAQERYQKWVTQLGGFNPWYVYRSAPGRGNWNVVALSGEFLLHKLGVRKGTSFIEESLGGQGDTFTSKFGLYLEGPMAYDHFPRLWAADMVAGGYNLRHAEDLREVLRRGALTSLFMQSPSGELPLGGRSAHHQWNEAEQCVTYEIYAAEAKKAGNLALAAAYKRGAHLALASMKRWVRPSGELSIVKNRVDPAQRHGFEGYSAHSQYNLLPMAMLSIAWEHAADTEDIAEKPAPCDVGGYVLSIDPFLHKTIANAGGMYIELDTSADLHYDANGLMRIHKRGMNPQIGPSETLVAHGWPQMPNIETTTSAIGPEWIGTDGLSYRLGEFGKGSGVKATVSDETQAPTKVSFKVTYDNVTTGPRTVTESYVVTPDQVEIASNAGKGSTAFVWPVLASDGQTSTAIDVKDKTVTVSLDGTSTQTFTAPAAARVSVTEKAFPNRNGWAKLGRAEFPNGGEMKVIVKPEIAKP